MRVRGDGGAPLPTPRPRQQLSLTTFHTLQHADPGALGQVSDNQLIDLSGYIYLGWYKILFVISECCWKHDLFKIMWRKRSLHQYHQNMHYATLATHFEKKYLRQQYSLDCSLDRVCRIIIYTVYVLQAAFMLIWLCIINLAREFDNIA